MSGPDTTRETTRTTRWGRPSITTWALLVATAASVTWAQLDARRAEGPAATLVSTRSAAWRVLPELAGSSASGATIELWSPHAADPVRLVPDGGGHALWVGETILGPADPEAVEGLWDSLRMATTVRAAQDATTPALGEGGRLAVTLPQDGRTRTVSLGRATPDAAGIYGAIEGGAEGTEGVWVLEQELSILVEQAPEAWLARRAVVAEPADLVAVHQGETSITRGLDGRWRGRVGPGAGPDAGSGALLDGTAVETRLDRVLSARLDPLVPARDDPGAPWLVLEGADGHDWTLRTHGACPQRGDRVLIDRGPGRWGCIDAVLVEPWPMPQSIVASPDRGALLEPRLVPHGYGRVLRVEQRSPTPQTLARHGGGWRIEQPAGQDDRVAIYDVDEAEVFRWYEALHEAEVVLADEAVGLASAEPPQVELVLVTDSTATLRLRCWSAPMRCRRDDGPLLQLPGPPPELGFSVDTFAERRLTELRSEDARAIEILPGAPGPGQPVLRQSAHFDLGVWRLDAPLHPAGDAALDELQLEALLGTLGALRADAWQSPPEGTPAERRIRIERVPMRGEDPVLELALWSGCVVQVGSQRAARIAEGPCETLRRDLLVLVPLERAVLVARGLELTLAGTTTRLRRQGETWADDAGGAAPEANAWLSAWADRRAESVRPGTPPGPSTWRLRILPERGTATTYEGGASWMQVQGEPWYYVLAPEDDASP